MNRFLLQISHRGLRNRSDNLSNTVKHIVSASIFAAIAFSANAQTISIDDMGKLDPSRMAAGRYRLDTHHSHVEYDVDHFGISRYHGLVGGMAGRLQIDPDRPSAASVDIEIPIEGLLSTTEALDAHLKTEDFFDVKTFPAARFRSVSISATGTNAVIKGELTLHGVTRPVALRTRLIGVAVNPMSQLTSAGFEATTRIKRSEFGVAYLVPFISDEVQLRITATFEKDE